MGAESSSQQDVHGARVFCTQDFHTDMERWRKKTPSILGGGRDARGGRKSSEAVKMQQLRRPTQVFFFL